MPIIESGNSTWIECDDCETILPGSKFTGWGYSNLTGTISIGEQSDWRHDKNWLCPDCLVKRFEPDVEEEFSFLP